MSESLFDSVYGVKMASNASLMEMAVAGSSLARQELRTRLPDLMRYLLDIYQAAYSDQEQIDPVASALDDIKNIVGISNP